MTSPIEDRNIILLGLSQHGKSAYLNQLLVTQKSASPQCATGKGFKRCTTEPQLVELHPPQRPTQILATDALPEPPETLLYQCLASLQGHADLAEKKPEGEALLRMQRGMWEWLSSLRPGLVLSYSANVRFSHPLVTSSPEVQPECAGENAVCLFRKRCLTNLLPERFVMADLLNYADPVTERLLQSKETKAKRNQGAEQELRIKALDTPGLEDSQGKDDENVLKIIDAVSKMGSLTAIVIVCRFDAPPAENWKQHVLRYWKLFPMLQAQWIVVHTRADPFSDYTDRENSSFEQTCQERRELVDQAIREVTQDDRFEAAHIFVENNIKDNQVLKAYFAHQQNTLSSLIATFQPIPIENLRFQKGKDLNSLDQTLLAAFEAEIDTVVKTLEDVKHETAAILKLQELNFQETKDIRCTLNGIDQKLKDIDHHGPVVTASKYLSAPWGFFWSPEASANLNPDRPDAVLEIEDFTGYDGKYLKRKCEDVKNVLPDGRVELRVSLHVPHFFTRLEARVKTTGPSNVVKAKDIEELKSDRTRLTQELEELEAQQEKTMATYKCRCERNDQLEKRHAEVAEMRLFLMTEWSIGTYKSFHQFYQEAKSLDHQDHRDVKERFEQIWRKAHRGSRSDKESRNAQQCS